MFLDGATADALDPPDRRPFRLYMEGVIGGMEECFQPPPSGMQTLCTPFRHPLDINVSTYRRLGGLAGHGSSTPLAQTDTDRMAPQDAPYGARNNVTRCPPGSDCPP
jgi:hypothetical protein